MKTEDNFRVGDHVKVINYGSPIWVNKKQHSDIPDLPIIFEDENMVWLDINVKIVGKTGVISQVSENKGIKKYSLLGIEEKTSWYDASQLKLINPPNS